MRVINTVASLTALILCAGHGAAQENPVQSGLYLLSGTIGGPMALYKITANGESPKLVRTVSESSDFVLGDNERGRLVVGSPWTAPSSFAIINMDKPDDQKTARIPYDNREVLPAYNEYLLELPDRGWAIALWLTQVGKQPSQWPQTLRAVFPNTAKPDAVDIPLDALRYIRTDGIPGLGGGNGSLDAPWVRGDPPGILLAGIRTAGLGAPRPPYLPKDPSERYSLMVDNDESIVLSGYTQAGPIDVFDKRSGTWARVNLPFTARRVRGFGPWLAAIAEESAYIPPGTTAVNAVGKDSNIVVRQSPGADIRLNEPVGRHGSVDDFFQAAGAYFPGRLFLYNTASKATFEIRTDQGDSEVLLITGEAVYYRVNDELFRAALTSVGVGKPSKLASGEEVLSSHWAFLRPR